MAAWCTRCPAPVAPPVAKDVRTCGYTRVHVATSRAARGRRARRDTRGGVRTLMHAAALVSAAAQRPWSWQMNSLPPRVPRLPANTSESSLVFARPAAGGADSAEVDMWVWPQAFRADEWQVSANAADAVCSFVAMQGGASTLPRASFLVYTLSLSGEVVRWRWVPTVDPPPEILMPAAALFSASADVLFAFGGYTIVTPDTCVDDEDAGFHCEECGAPVRGTNVSCFLPSRRTHLFFPSNATWVSLSPNATGPGTPASVLPLRAQYDGIFTFGLCYAHDEATESVVSTCGYQQFFYQTPGLKLTYAPLFTFSLRSWAWNVSNTSYVDPPGASNSWPNSNAPYVAATAITAVAQRDGRRELVLYGGVDISRRISSGSCYVLDLDTAAWRAQASCAWTAPTSPFYVYDAITVVHRPSNRLIVLGGRSGDPSLGKTIIAVETWALRLSDYIWERVDVLDASKGTQDQFTALGVYAHALVRGSAIILPVPPGTQDRSPTSMRSVPISMLVWGGSMFNASLDRYYDNMIDELCTRSMAGETDLQGRYVTVPGVLHIITGQVDVPADVVLRLPRVVKVLLVLLGLLWAADCVTSAWACMTIIMLYAERRKDALPQRSGATVPIVLLWAYASADATVTVCICVSSMVVAHAVPRTPDGGAAVAVLAACLSTLALRFISNTIAAVVTLRRSDVARHTVQAALHTLRARWHSACCCSRVPGSLRYTLAHAMAVEYEWETSRSVLAYRVRSASDRRCPSMTSTIALCGARARAVCNAYAACVSYTVYVLFMAQRVLAHPSAAALHVLAAALVTASVHAPDDAEGPSVIAPPIAAFGPQLPRASSSAHLAATIVPTGALELRAPSSDEEPGDTHIRAAAFASAAPSPPPHPVAQAPHLLHAPLPLYVEDNSGDARSALLFDRPLALLRIVPVAARGVLLAGAVCACVASIAAVWHVRLLPEVAFYQTVMDRVRTVSRVLPILAVATAFEVVCMLRLAFAMVALHAAARARRNVAQRYDALAASLLPLPGGSGAMFAGSRPKLDSEAVPFDGAVMRV